MAKAKAKAKKPAAKPKKPAKPAAAKPAKAAAKKPRAAKPAKAAATKMPTRASARSRGLSVDDYLLAQPSPQREVLAALRGTITAAVPGLTESIKWGQPVFELNGPLIFLRASKHHVTFGFWRGADLEEQGFTGFEGSGDRMRHLKLTQLDDLDRSIATRLVQAAAKLNAERGDPTKGRR